jgi:hypothetical protein
MRRIASSVVLAAVLSVGGSLAGLGVGTAGAGASPVPVMPATWSLGSIPSPSLTHNIQLASVTCASSTFCVAVGNQDTATVNSSLIERWDGSKWSIVKSLDPAGAGESQLYGVSCAGPSFCVAVGVWGPGSTFVNPLIEQWNGTAWTLATGANPSGSVATQLSAVSCLSSMWCTGVGYTKDGSNNRHALVEKWDGTAWTVVTTTPPTGETTSQFDALSCAKSSWCMAVGGYTNASSNFVSLAEVWNGTAWSVVPSPNPGAGTSGELNGVSCAGGGFCAAVGQWYNGTHFQAQLATWNGTAWTNVTPPEANPGIQNFLDDVSCTSATSCGAVGSASNGSVASPVALTWDGSTWSLVPAPVPQGATSSGTSSITCLTNWECVAVGTFDPVVSQPYVMTAPIARSGYRFVASDGGVFAYGPGAPFLGSLGSTILNAPVVGMTVMPAGDGYYLVASDGGVFSYGSAKFYGSTGSMHLNKPVVGMAITPDGAGYWLVASDGGIFTYGDAAFYGSTGSLHLNKPVVGMAASPDGKGYYLVASDGGIFNYGAAAFSGSTGSIVLNKPVVGMAVPTSGGYYLVASDGGIFAYPTAGGPPFFGSTGSMVLNKPIVGMTAVAGGYYLSGSDGGVFTYPTTGGPTFYGSTGSIVLNKPIVGIAG